MDGAALAWVVLGPVIMTPIRAMHAAVCAIPSPRTVNTLRRLWRNIDTRCGWFFLTVLLLASVTGDASAQRHAARQAEPSGGQAEARATYLESYRIPLALGYAAPVVAAGMAVWLPPNSPYSGLWSLSLLAAPIVHLAHGNVGGGFRSLLGVALAPFAGGLLGFGLSQAACRGDSFSETCLGWSLVGFAGGAILGYLFFAALDVALFGEVERAKPSQQALVTPHIAPVLGPASAKNPRASELQGLTLGARIRL